MCMCVCEKTINYKKERKTKSYYVRAVFCLFGFRLFFGCGVQRLDVGS